MKSWAGGGSYGWPAPPGRAPSSPKAPQPGLSDTRLEKQEKNSK